MSQQLLKEVEQESMKKSAPDIRPGMTVRVHQRIKEGEKERIQIFEGLVLAVSSGSGIAKNFTVRKVVDGVGVEKVFPLYGNAIAKIEVKKASKIRRAKLYYMRGLQGRKARLRDTAIKMREQEMEQSAAELAEQAEQKAQEEGENKAENQTAE